MDSENYKPVGCCEKCKGILGRTQEKWGFICDCPCHQDLGQTELGEELNAKINSYLSVGTDNNSYEEWISEADQIEMRTDLLEWVTNLLLFQEKRHREDLDKLLEQGHGGGSWRRLITMLRDKYLKN